MKSIIASILGVCCAILIGSLFMKQSGEVEMPVMNVLSNPKAFQLGAYKDINVAQNQIDTVGGIMISDSNYYYVYYAILADEANIERMTKYLNNKNIYYYIKDINANDVFLNELNRYEELMKDTTTDIAFMELNKKILSIYGDNYEN